MTSNFCEPGWIKPRIPFFFCPDNYCVAGAVFLKADLEEDESFYPEDDGDKKKRQNAWRNKRYATEPEFRERQNRQRRERYANDPSYRKRRKQKQREYYKNRKGGQPLKKKES